MIHNYDLEQYLNKILMINNIKDYSPNGLQIEGKKNIEIIVTGVSINMELIKQAIIKKADAILVHHGFFWNNESMKITNIKYKRIKKILDNNINIFSYHLPLDTHKTLGNNIQLAKKLNLSILDYCTLGNIKNLGIICSNSLNLYNLINNIKITLNREPLVVGNTLLNKNEISKIAICTGAGQNFIEEVKSKGVNIYLSGEISERTTLVARELNMIYISAGHHATERYGIQHLGNELKNTFNIKQYFIDIDNPV